MCDVAGVQGGVGLDGAGHAAVDGGKLVINRHLPRAPKLPPAAPPPLAPLP